MKRFGILFLSLAVMALSIFCPVGALADTPLSIGLPNQQLGSVNLLLFIKKDPLEKKNKKQYFLPLISVIWLESTQ